MGGQGVEMFWRGRSCIKGEAESSGNSSGSETEGGSFCNTLLLCNDRCGPHSGMPEGGGGYEGVRLATEPGCHVDPGPSGGFIHRR